MHGLARNEEDEGETSDVSTSVAAASYAPPPEELNVQSTTKRSSSRKRDDAVCAAQLSAVLQEIADIKAALEKSPNSADAREAAGESLEMRKRIEFLQRKLEAHHHWMDELKKLLVSAPLLDYAIRRSNMNAPQSVNDDDNDDDDDEETKAEPVNSDSQDVLRELPTLDEWREKATGENFSSTLVARHVDEAVTFSQINARKLLNEFANPACAFAVTFDTRGWSIAANMDSKLLTFRASRVVPSLSAGSIAIALWKSIQYDDILRTFVLTVLDATVVYEAASPCRCVTERVVQIEAGGPIKTIVMTDSMEDVSRDGVESWQIAVESCDDPCVAAFIAQTKASPPTPAPVSPFAARGSASAIDVVVAARCSQPGQRGVLVELAGSIQHDGTSLLPPKSHVDLVQYMINVLPVYEELQLLAKP